MAALTPLSQLDNLRSPRFLDLEARRLAELVYNSDLHVEKFQSAVTRTLNQLKQVGDIATWQLVERNWRYVQSHVRHMKEKNLTMTKEVSTSSPFLATDLGVFADDYPTPLPLWGIYRRQLQEIHELYEKFMTTTKIFSTFGFRRIVLYNAAILLTRPTGRILIQKVCSQYDRITVRSTQVVCGGQCHPPIEDGRRSISIDLYLKPLCTFTTLPQGTEASTPHHLWSILAHELIHAAHFAEGTVKANQLKTPTLDPRFHTLEEQITISGYGADDSYDPLCENQILREFNTPPRAHHVGKSIVFDHQISPNVAVLPDLEAEVFLKLAEEGNVKEMHAFLGVNKHLKLSTILYEGKPFLFRVFLAAIKPKSLDALKNCLKHEGISDYRTLLQVNPTLLEMDAFPAQYFFSRITNDDLEKCEEFDKINSEVNWEQMRYLKDSFLNEAFCYWLDSKNASMDILRILQRMGLSLEESIAKHPDFLTMWNNPNRFIILGMLKDNDSIDFETSTIDRIDSLGSAPIHYLAERMTGLDNTLRLAYLRKLVSKKPNFLLLDAIGQSALHRAISEYQLVIECDNRKSLPFAEETIQILMQCAPNVLDSNGDPVLFSALGARAFQAVHYLLTSCPAINARFINSKGETALHALTKEILFEISIETGRIVMAQVCSIIRMLVIQFGVDYEQKDLNGKVFFDYIKSSTIKKEILDCLPLYSS